MNYHPLQQLLSHLLFNQLYTVKKGVCYTPLGVCQLLGKLRSLQGSSTYPTQVFTVHPMILIVTRLLTSKGCL